MRVCIWVVASAVVLALAVLALIHHGRSAVLAFDGPGRGPQQEDRTCRCDGFAWRRADLQETSYCVFFFTVAASRGHGSFASRTSYAWSPFSGTVWIASSMSAH